MKFLHALITVCLATACAEEKHARRPENPLDHLPQNIEVLTHFGERPGISPDNQRVAFMAKSLSDAMLIALKPRGLTCLTCTVPAAASERVFHLVAEAL